MFSRSTTLTRRALVVGAGATIASAALTGSFVQAADAVPAVPALAPAVLEAIAEWNRCQDATALAWAAWDAREPRAVYHGTDARYLAWFSRCEEAEEAKSQMLNLLRSTDLDLAHIYRRA